MWIDPIQWNTYKQYCRIISCLFRRGRTISCSVRRIIYIPRGIPCFHLLFEKSNSGVQLPFLVQMLVYHKQNFLCCNNFSNPLYVGVKVAEKGNVVKGDSNGLSTINPFYKYYFFVLFSQHCT